MMECVSTVPSCDGGFPVSDIEMRFGEMDSFLPVSLGSEVEPY